MHSTMHRIALGGSIAALILTTACGKKDAPTPADAPPVAVAPPAPVALAVSSIDLGKTIDASQKIAVMSTTFGMRDTIYASVSTVGAGTNATVGAKWSFVSAAGKEILINETSQTISPAGPVATEFHISKASAWPKGNYKVEITFNGTAAGVKEFTIQ